MVLQCFDGLVGLREYCGADMPLIALEDHGVDASLIAQLTGSQDTVPGLVAQVENRARAIVNNDVVTRWAPSIKAHTFLDRYRAGQFDDRQELMSSTGAGGIIVEVNQPRSNVKLTIGTLALWSNVTQPVTITIYNLVDGTVAATHVIDAQADQITSEGVQIVLPAHREFAAYFITHNLPDYYRVDLYPGCGSCGLRGYSHGGVRVIGGRIPAAVPVTRGNVRYTSHTSGLSAVVTVDCDHGQGLCEMKNVLAMPYALKVCEEIIRRGIHQVNRMNAQRLDLDLLKERADRYGAEYAAAMSNILGQAVLPADPWCFSCKNPVTSSVTAP